MVQEVSLLILLFLVFFCKRNLSFNKFNTLLTYKKVAGRIERGESVISVNVKPSSKQKIRRTPLIWIKY